MNAARILLVTLFFIPAVAFAQDALVAGVKQVTTVGDARQEIMKGVVQQIGTGAFLPVDPHYAEHLQARINHKTVINDRLINIFGSNKYSVTKKCALDSYYYSSSGALIKIEYSSTPGFSDETCPSTPNSKSYAYDYPSGQLLEMVLSKGNSEDFMFKPDGTFLGHWIGHHCYRQDGSSCGTRDWYVERKAR
jgi:hypothetical protein